MNLSKTLLKTLSKIKVVKTIELEQYEISLIEDLINNCIEKINSGTISYGSKEDDADYEFYYQNILNKLL